MAPPRLLFRQVRPGVQASSVHQGFPFVDDTSDGHQRVLSKSSSESGKRSLQSSQNAQVHSGSLRSFSHKRVPSVSSTCSVVTKATLTPSYVSSHMLATHFDVIEALGQGSFGLVELVQERRTGRERACKTIDTATLQPNVLEMVRMEVELLRGLDHPYIVKLFEYVEDFDRHEIILILEHMSGGTCAELLQRSQEPLKETVVARIVCQVLVAVAYCHSKGVSHRDLKPEHVMLISKEIGCPFVCKVIDFGLATDASHGMRDFVGTPEYMAPEVMNGVPYTSQADIWSVGITTLELLTGAPPFGPPSDYSYNDPVFLRLCAYRNFDDVEEHMRDMDVLSAWVDRSEDSRDFIKKLLVQDPQKRPAATSALTHIWCAAHQDAPVGLSNELLQSIARYMDADPLVRCCLLAIAVRMGSMEQDRINKAFVRMDTDCDGEVSERDLAEALADPVGHWSGSKLLAALRASVVGDRPKVDVSSLVRFADLGHSGGLSYTEFVAACLYSRENATESLVDLAFGALDDNRDGWIEADDVFALFEQCVFSEMQKPPLPLDRPVCLAEWRTLFDSDFVRMAEAEAPMCACAMD